MPAFAICSGPRLPISACATAPARRSRLAADPTDPSALANLGMFELEAADASAAAKRFAEALLLDPRNGPALAGLAEALTRHGEPERAARVRRQ